ncbi:outer membrane beta-barrel protein [Halomonas campisalis]|uniref:Outer membrane beta-barrel protein n=1 Tax=Billgrantia campisalis TaxID=74661 RepID=A0ABS9PDC0_9GAMM|nr:outer membrane beta-barrel protein [Halomonas campisalis]MCG6659764.1 outer membrane beta-barrel protein [Halomonas campisalis]MDR5864921.1 outer membrane beta-barrel protein [Halomonas campisalis]
MKKLGASAALAIAVALPLTAQAAGSNFSYTQLSGAFVATWLDDDIVLPVGNGWYELHDSMGGLGLSGSYQFTDNLFVALSGTYRASRGDTEINVTDVGLSLGYALPAGERTDLVFQGGVVNTEVEVCTWVCGKVDDNGMLLGMGVRHWVNAAFELNGGVTHVNYDDFDSNTALNVGFAYWSSPAFSMVTGLIADDDSTSLTVGFRYTFN